MKRCLISLLLFLLLLGCLPPRAQAAPAQELTLGILAVYNKEQMQAAWQPIANQISTRMPGYRLKVRILEHAEMLEALKQRQLDFVLTNPVHYIVLRENNGFSGALATLILREGNKPLSSFGGVIVTHSDRADINQLADLKGKKIACAVTAPGSFAGYNLQLHTMQQAGLPQPDPKQLLVTGLPQNKVITAVLDGRADVGFVRTGMLEKLEQQGTLAPGKLKIINRQDLPDYPYASSTRLYPEWPVVALPHLDTKLTGLFAGALLSLEQGTPLLQKAGLQGFGIPANYQPVETMLRDLRQPPYDVVPAFTLLDAWQRWRWQIIGASAGVTAMIVMILQLVVSRREKKQALAELQTNEVRLSESEGRLQVAQHLAQVGDWELDLQTNHLIWSDEIFRIFEINPAEFDASYEAFMGAVHPDDRELVNETFASSVNNRTSYSVDHRLLTKSGTIKFVQETGKTFYDDQGNPVRSIGTVQDITLRKKAEEEVQRAKETAQRYLDIAGVMLGVLDRTGTIILMNRKGHQILDYPEGELLGRNWFEVCLPVTIQDQIKEIFRQQMHGDFEPLEFYENTILNSAGEERLIAFHNTLLYDDDGVCGVLFSGEDITEQKRFEQQLAFAKDAAEAANRAKSEFLANMSHEIRTPMNGMVGMAQLLRYTNPTDEQTEYLDNLELSCQNLLSLINDILDLSKIESGKLILEAIDFSLAQTIHEVITNQAVRIRQKGLELTTHIQQHIPEMVKSDSLRFKQILLNLLGNAIKFTEKGGITISASVCSQHDQTVTIRFAVSDTGIGMAGETLSRIFNAFEQAESSTTRRFGGSGLGLAICRRLTELLGGRIWAESVEGKGSTFFVELPFLVSKTSQENGEEHTKNQLVSSDIRYLNILLAEDNDINAATTAAILKGLGHQAEVAANGKEAIDLWHNGTFDLILMDIQMPVMDGFIALSVIREHEKRKGEYTPIIALTAYALQGDREKFIAQGFDGYISKPMDMKMLVSELARLTAGN